MTLPTTYATPLDEALTLAFERRGRTARSFARELGIEESMLSRWRQGHHTPELHTGREIARLLKAAGVKVTVAKLWPPEEATDA
jgi:transcriptional regulator with XRE-family HTH domain